ncbi:carbonic anhydrase [uncultured Megasphaera sp.]|uniref:beta-class carbonic anhydrase n=1 Tax=uncultured Megasphaera sp. TaxID=165188 RepID=UPI002657E2AD|nr:carbonic anhydrase [uncultured Megasphaera sp.]
MSLFTEQIIKANEAFMEKHLMSNPEEVSKYPNRNLAVLTCMDTRLLDFLEPAMGLRRGEAKIIKVAGNTACEDFDSVIGSLMVAVYELHVHDIVVMGHDDCGMLKTTSASLCEKMAAAGIAPEHIEAVRPKLKQWADRIGNIDESVRETVRHLRANPYLPDTLSIYGMVIHPHSGEIRVVADC